MTDALTVRVRLAIREARDFPTPGIVFKDITPVLADAELLGEVLRTMAAPFAGLGITHVVAIESRGFLFATPIAQSLGAALTLARKPGKLPWKSVREAFALEYGNDSLEMHIDALSEGSRVLIVDDVLATGGTAAAAVRLVQGLGGTVSGVSVLGEIAFLRGRELLADVNVQAIVRY